LPRLFSGGVFGIRLVRPTGSTGTFFWTLWTFAWVGQKPRLAGLRHTAGTVDATIRTPPTTAGAELAEVAAEPADVTSTADMTTVKNAPKGLRPIIGQG
jgi:hypothetical protein